MAIEKTLEERRVVTGFHEAYGSVYRQLGFDDLLPTAKNRSARIANPDSKRGTVRRLESDLGVSTPVQRICRMTDRLDKEVIERVNDFAIGAVDADGLREFGFSKNGRHARTQVLLALMVTSDRLPISYELLHGSDCEGNSLIPAPENTR